MMPACFTTAAHFNNLTGMMDLRNATDFDDIKTMIQEGKVTPVIDRTYPLSEIRAAVGYVDEGHARAKVVLTVD